MDGNIIITNLTNPPILFFLLGMGASFLRVDLEIPKSLAKFLSLYLLLVIGFHGGVELSKAGITLNIMRTIMVAIGASILTPFYTFFILRKKVKIHDAAAIAATYGAGSAVTFVTAANFLYSLNIPFGGYMVAAMALIESPAIMSGLYLYHVYNPQKQEKKSAQQAHAMREIFLNSSVYLMLGSLLVGIIAGEHGFTALKPFTSDIFKGMLSFFMLDMGIIAAKRMWELKANSLFLSCFALCIPLINAITIITLSYLLGISKGNCLLLCASCASASYIAVPAVMRLIIPEASPGIYIPMALGITFPFNIAFGLPLYFYIISKVLS
ncbi:MAG: sodium-dependent bicarbonate transport family permease [Epsilonproteobacteria bacterium]|nr:sodium-dependent bicarbonate transport family permease [Campylobacterota bacterium]